MPWRALAALAALALTACSGPATSTDPAPPDDGSAIHHPTTAEVPVEVDTGSAPGWSEESWAPQPPDLLDGVTFRDEGTSGFVPTEATSRSTFALDVDNGSFRIASTLASSGYQIPPESIRAEEWINAFTYTDPSPVHSDLALTTETALAPTLQDGTQVVRVGVTARTVAEPPPVNVSLVVDTSGSMDIRERIGLVRQALTMMAEQLRPTDIISVVSFGSDAQVLLPPTPVAEREALLNTVERLTTGGSTNLDAGLQLGYEQVQRAYLEEGTNVVVLCSDGVSNTGVTDLDELLASVSENRQGGISLVTVGFGMGNYNDVLMEQLANRGNGFYRYVDSREEAHRTFVQELPSILAPVARDARAQASFDPDLVREWRLIGYENREMENEDFTDMSVEAGALGSGHRATALYEVRLTDGVPPGTQIGAVQVRWLTVPDEAEQMETAGIYAAVNGQAPSSNLLLATTVADTAQFLKGSVPMAHRNVTIQALAARADALAGSGNAEADRLIHLLSGATEYGAPHGKG
ncbi:MAG: von Willebrand factor type A domain-containing protein [Actinomycetia bacterium]|nr:von Willebrand factor type A domain-containing protein [Actinomycetes bacterium]